MGRVATILPAVGTSIISLHVPRQVWCPPQTVFSHRHHRGFIEHNAFAFHAHKGIGHAKVNCQIMREKTEYERKSMIPVLPWVKKLAKRYRIDKDYIDVNNILKKNWLQFSNSI